MNKNILPIIVEVILILSLFAVAAFFSKEKPEIIENIADNEQEETSENIELSADVQDTPDIDQAETINPNTNTDTTSSSNSQSSGRNMYRGGGGGSSGGSSSGSPSESSPSNLNNDESDIELLNILKNSGKTQSEIPPPAIPI